MGGANRPQVYKPTNPQIIERFSREVAERLGDSLQDIEARTSFTQNLSMLLNLAARIKAKYLNNQCQNVAATARKGES